MCIRDRYKLTVKTVTVKKTNKDIWFIFQDEEGSSFKGILRWGKGAGFSCLRVDLK